MKKKLLAIVLCICAVFSMAACSRKTAEKSSSDGEITLGKYKGYQVSESTAKVTDEAVQKYLNSILAMYATTSEVTEGTTAEGSVVNVTYHMTVNGTEVGDFKLAEDGTTSLGISSQVTLTEGTFGVDGFTTALVGHAVGETVEMDLTLPADYSDTTLAGQPVHYSVTINSMSQTTIPEYNDAFVAEHYAFAGYQTTADFTELIRKEVYYIQVSEKIWDDVLDAQKVKQYNTKELQEYVDRMFAQVESTVSGYGVTMDSYYEMMGTTKEGFLKQLESDCKPVIKEKMFIRAVAGKEKIKYSEEEAARYAAISGYTSVDEFKKYLENYGEDLEYNVLSYMVQNFIYESVEVIPDEEMTAEETTAEETTAGETAAEETAAEETTAEAAVTEETTAGE